MKPKELYPCFYTQRSIITYRMQRRKEAADTKKTQTTQTESGTEAITDLLRNPEPKRQGFRTKLTIYISRRTRFFRSCGCMEQGVWHDE